jgi:chemotaxis protein methyltransferase CheR
MQTDLFQRFAKLAYDKAGIALKDGKEALVQARVTKRVRALELSDAAAYLDYLEREDDGEELLSFLDVISTHFTSFFREPDHFEELERAVATWMGEGQRRFRFWSAASSTGEEPYSMAMTLLAMSGSAQLDWKILATDIALATLQQAQAGRYEAARVAPVPAELARRYLRKLPGGTGEGAHFAVGDEVRARVVFQRLNLAQPPFPMKGPLDVVFCRNVLIYFDQPTRQRLIAAIEELLRPGGLLCIGHTETLNGVRTGFKMTRPSVFRKPAGEVAR